MCVYIYIYIYLSFFLSFSLSLSVYLAGARLPVPVAHPPGRPVEMQSCACRAPLSSYDVEGLGFGVTHVASWDFIALLLPDVFRRDIYICGEVLTKLHSLHLALQESYSAAHGSQVLAQKKQALFHLSCYGNSCLQRLPQQLLCSTDCRGREAELELKEMPLDGFTIQGSLGFVGHKLRGQRDLSLRRILLMLPLLPLVLLLKLLPQHHQHHDGLLRQRRRRRLRLRQQQQQPQL